MRHSEINVERTNPNMIELTIDGTVHTLDNNEVRELGRKLGFMDDPGRFTVPYRTDSLPEPTDNEMATYMSGRKIQAVKDMRQRTNCGLREAKDALDNTAASWFEVCEEVHRY